MTAALWNALYPEGTKVAAYPGTLTDEPLITVTRSAAWPLGHGEPMVLVEDYSGGIVLGHVHPLDRGGPIPTRIQRRRDKGWRSPTGARYVGRGTKFGNPYTVGETYAWTPDCDTQPEPLVPGWDYTGVRLEIADAQSAVSWFQSWITTPNPQARPASMAVEHWELRNALPQLAGRNLMCWCKTTEPCHADVLLLAANTPGDDQ